MKARAASSLFAVWLYAALGCFAHAEVLSINDMQGLRHLPPPASTQSSSVLLAGYYQPGDGGGGQFYWDAESSANDNGGSVIMPSAALKSGRWIRVFSGPANVLWFGAKGDNQNNDAKAISNALDAAGIAYLPPAPRGQKNYYYIGDTTLWLRGNQGIIGETPSNSAIRYDGKGSAIAGTRDNPLNLFCQLRRLRIRIDQSGANAQHPVIAVDWSRFSYSQFSDLMVEMRAANQTGFHGAGNGKGSGPYYNTWSGIYVGGRANPDTTPGQSAFVFAASGRGGSDGPNANVFNNLGHIWGVEKAFDIQAGNGNLFYGVVAQSIQKVVFDFNAPPAGGDAPTGQKAVENKIFGVRVEGRRGATFARFNPGASRNWIEGAFVESLGAGNIVSDSSGNNNNRVNANHSNLSPTSKSP